MLADRTAGEAIGEAVRPRPAMYKKEYPWLKEVDSLALCNVQMDLEAAFRAHKERKGIGHPRYKSKHHSRRSYTTNVVNGNIRIEGKKIRLPKVGMVKVDRFFPSSKRCSCCGRIRKDLSLKDRVYHCSCGNIMDRDLNAAINIRNEAKRMLHAS